MYAIIEACGKQYKVAEGDEVFVEKLDLNEGDKVTFDKVLLLSDGEKHQLLRVQKLKLLLLKTEKLKKWLYSNTKLRKTRERNKDTDNHIQRLKLIRLAKELLQRKLLLLQQKKLLNN